jgi:hypothetical protein
MRLKVLGCELLYREIHYCAARSRAVTDVEFLPKQLSEQKREQMRAALQAVVDAQRDPEAEAVVFAFGLCHGGVLDFQARDKPLIVPTPKQPDDTCIPRAGQPCRHPPPPPSQPMTPTRNIASFCRTAGRRQVFAERIW